MSEFVRQKSFEIDSDSTDTSLADISNIVSEVREIDSSQQIA